jgi:hypothetical protein
MKRMSLVLTAILFLSTQGFADSMSFTIEQGILGYAKLDTTTKVTGAADAKETETIMTTMPNSLQVCGSLDNLNLYFYPTQQNAAFGAGYMAKKNLELGVSLALNSDKYDKAKSENSTTAAGVWAAWSLAAGPGSLEVSLPLTLTSGTQKDPATGVDNTLSGTTVQLVGNYFLPLAKNVFWFGGLGYKMDSQVQKIAGGGKRTVNTNGLVLNLTSLRFTF